MKRVVAVIGVLVTVLSVGGIVRLAVPAVSAHSGVRAQLTFIRDALRSGAADEAQQSFPEGYFFLHVLYGLTWVEVGRLEPPTGRAEALREARWALARLDTDAGRAPFPAALTPSHGIFYRGWTNWLRGGVLSLQPPDRRDRAEADRLAADSAEIAAAFTAAPTPYLQAYEGQAWPVDSTVAMASLRLHDTLLPPRFGAVATRWVTDVKARLDPATGLLPHTAHPDDGYPGEARGTSQSMITRFLLEIDPTFGREQYLRFRSQFVTRPLGLGPVVREYPPFVLQATGDVDSGPLVLGASLSATVVTIGAANVQGDDALATALASYGELAGVPLSTPWTKRYGLGLVPVGDAFIAWSKMSSAWVAPAPPFTASRAVPWWWPAPLVAILTALAVTPWLRPLRRRAATAAARLPRSWTPRHVLACLGVQDRRG